METKLQAKTEIDGGSATPLRIEHDTFGGTSGLITSCDSPSLELIRQDANRFPRLKSYDKDVAIKNMSGIIVKTYIYLGRKAPDAKDVRFIAKQVLIEIERDIFGLSLSNITFEEIERAVIKRIIDAPDNIYGISVCTFLSAIIEYAKTEGSDAAKRAYISRDNAIREGLIDFANTPLMKNCIEEMTGNASLDRAALIHSSPLPFTHETGMPNSPGEFRHMGSGPYPGDSDDGIEMPPPESPL